MLGLLAGRPMEVPPTGLLAIGLPATRLLASPRDRQAAGRRHRPPRPHSPRAYPDAHMFPRVAGAGAARVTSGEYLLGPPPPGLCRPPHPHVDGGRPRRLLCPPRRPRQRCAAEALQSVGCGPVRRGPEAGGGVGPGPPRPHAAGHGPAQYDRRPHWARGVGVQWGLYRSLPPLHRHPARPKRAAAHLLSVPRCGDGSGGRCPALEALTLKRGCRWAEAGVGSA